MESLKEKLWRIKRSFKNGPIVRRLSDMFESIANTVVLNSNEKAQNGWSIVVVTGGQANQALSQLVRSAEKELTGTPCEVIIVGPGSSVLDFKPVIPVRFFAYREIGLAPGWITKKKNIGARLAKYDKLAICHDYVLFQTGWKKGYDDFGDDFDVCMNRITNADGTRFRDWIAWDYPEIGYGLLPYHIECTEFQIISGTYFVAKREFYLDNPLNEKLRWGEGEDEEWSLRIRQKTRFKLNLKSEVTFSKLKMPIRDSWLVNTKKFEKLFSGSEKADKNNLPIKKLSI
jgi:hypothetical protein